MTASEFPVSTMAAGLVGSEILKIAGQIRARLAQGEKVINLTVGDFNSAQFPIPASLRQRIFESYEAGETNYPPSDGMPDLRAAVSEFYRDRLGLDYAPASVVTCGGVRPAIYATYRLFIDPGDMLLYPVPSWNNNHYAWLTAARGQAVAASPESLFLPTAADLAPYLPEARVFILNSPLNPAGTTYSETELEKIVRLVLDENAGRARRGRKPVMLLYDQVYWMLTFGSARHLTPVGIDPRMREFTIFADGMSKSFASTGLRVGWVVGPEGYMKPMSDILGHVGAWAPRPEQVACARFLRDPAAMDAYEATFKAGLKSRLDALHAGFQELKAAGYAVDSIAPMGAIYLSARLNLIGRTAGDLRLDSNEAIRRFILEEAGIAIIPFQAFGLKEETGWFRLSVGALSTDELPGLFPALRKALDRVR